MVLGMVAIALAIAFKLSPSLSQRAGPAALLEVNVPPYSGSDTTSKYSPEAMDRAAAGVAMLARGRNVMMAVLLDPDLRRMEWFKKDPNTALRRLTKEVRIDHIRGTSLIRVTMTSDEGLETPDIINAVAKAIVMEFRKRAQSAITSDLRLLQTQLEMIDSNLQMGTERLSFDVPERPEPVKIAQLEMTLSNSTAELRALQTEACKLEVERSRLAALGRMIENLKPEHFAELVEVQAALEADELFQTLNKRLKAMQAQRAEDAATTRPEDPEVAKLDASIKETLKELDDRRSKVALERVKQLKKEFERYLMITTQQLLLIRTDVRRVAQETEDMTKELAMLKAKHKGLVDAFAEMSREKERQLDSLRERKKQIERRVDELRMEMRSAEPVELVRPAYAPLR